MKQKIKLLADCAQGKEGEIIFIDEAEARILIKNNLGAEVIEEQTELVKAEEIAAKRRAKHEAVKLQDLVTGSPPEKVKRIIDLKRAMRVKGEFYPARQYKVPDEISWSLADWFIEKGMAEEVKVEVLEGPSEANRDKKIVEEARPTPQKTAFDKLQEIVGGHLVEIYSDTGNGKSRLVHHIAVEAEKAGKKVLYLDTEKSLPVGYEKQLRKYEVHTAKTALDLLKQLIARVRRARDEELDLIIVDSIGLPVLASLPEMSMRERGDAFQLMASLRFQMMGFAFEHGLTIATNQPVSELAQVGIAGKQPRVAENEPLPPFGGKSEFMAKLILRSEAIQKTPNKSIFKLVVYKAREHGREYELARFSIGKDGVSIDWKV